MLRYAFTVAGGREAAQDCVQEAFLRFFIARSSGREIRSPKAWLFRVIRNHALDQKRAGSRHEIGLHALLNVPGPDHDPEERYSRSELLKTRLNADLSPREVDCVGFGPKACGTTRSRGYSGSNRVRSRRCWRARTRRFARRPSTPVASPVS